ncbi:hypothetical protein F4803DRAFT_247464 [Xylaria telfairii]|nr:hypothetical protein F4803DRAFT_247464 [Xylaria telfairii]
MSAFDHHESASRSSLRRSACDRCRTMKLKCLRDRNYPQTCLRCFRTAVQCLTGPAKPLGRAARAAVGPSREPAKLQEAEISSTNPSSASVDISGATFYNNDHLVNSSTLFDQILLEPIHGDRSFLGQCNMDCSPTAIENTIMHIPETDGNEESATSSQSSESLNINIYDARDSRLQFYRLNLTLSEQLLFFTTHLWEDILSTTCASNNAETSNCAGCSSQSNHICKVLGLTFEFVSNLRQYLPLQQSSTHMQHQMPPPPPLWTTVPSPPQTPKTESSDGSPEMLSFLSAPWLFGAPANSIPSPGITLPPIATATPTNGNVELSVVAILNILSCYLHLVAIFGIFFRHMHTFLCQTPASSLPTLQTIPGLRLADMHVDHGGLQLKILIQVIEHQFVMMENSLGLLDEHRVFPRHQGRWSNDCQGIRLDGCEIGMLLTDVMGSNVAASATRIVASLREEIAKVRQLL